MFKKGISQNTGKFKLATDANFTVDSHITKYVAKVNSHKPELCMPSVK